MEITKMEPLSFYVSPEQTAQQMLKLPYRSSDAWRSFFGVADINMVPLTPPNRCND